MSTLEIIALVRDISVIIASGILIIILLSVGFMLFRLYPPIKRTVGIVEKSSGIVLNIVSQPLNLIHSVSDIIGSGTELIKGFRKEERKEGGS